MAQILVVDDNSACRNSLKTVLESHGYEVVCAHDGQLALNHLRSGLRPSLILLDLEMPDMNGFEFRANQREDERLCRIPVVLVSGESYLSTIAEALGVEGFLTKPVEASALLSLILRLNGRE